MRNCPHSRTRFIVMDGIQFSTTTFPTGEQSSRSPQPQHGHIPCPSIGQKSLCWAFRILLVYQSAVTPTSDHGGPSQLWLRMTSKRSEIWVSFIIIRVFILTFHWGEALRLLWFCCARLCRRHQEQLSCLQAPSPSFAAQHDNDHSLEEQDYSIHGLWHGTPPASTPNDHGDSPG